MSRRACAPEGALPPGPFPETRFLEDFFAPFFEPFLEPFFPVFF